jgi:drug/metabolite transporter (DMT)-like permease
MLPERRAMTAYLLLGLVMLLWAGNSIVARGVRFDVPPLTLAFVRWLGASLILLPFVWRTLRDDLPALRASWKWVLALALLGISAFNGLLYPALHYTTASKALLLQAAVPLLVMVLDRVLHGTGSSLWQKLGTICSMLGVAVIVFEGQLERLLALHLGFGDALLLGSVLVWALYTVLLRHRPKVAPLSFLFVTFTIGALTMAPLALWEWVEGARIVWSGKVVGAFAYVCVLPSIVSYLIYNKATDTVGPARAGQAITLMPLFGAFLSAALLGEMLLDYHWEGMALILAGIALGAMALRRQATGAPAAPRLEDRA